MATRTAASTSYADVKAAYDLCNTGDTLAIPTGSSSWTTTLVVSKGIIIQGNGIGNTNITNGGTGGTYEELIQYEPSNYSLNSPFRLTGITFDANGKNSLRLGSSNKSGPFTLQTNVRIDHNEFVNGGSDSKGFAIWNHGTLYGVVDNNTFDGYYPVANEGGHNISSGDTWWANEPQSIFQYGSAYYLYWEDNIFTVRGIIMNGQNNVRFVVRYNTITTGDDIYSLMELHGQQTEAVACFGAEIYGNNVNSGAYDLALFKQRSGQTLVFYNNATASTTPWIQGYTGGLDTCPGNYATAKVTHNSYWWNNRRNLTGNLFLSEAVGGLDCVGLEDIPTLGRDIFSDTTTPAVTSGPFASRPAVPVVGQGYWATDQSTSNLTGLVGTNPTAPISGTLYKCLSAGVWTEIFTPYTYPHPLRGEGAADKFVLVFK